MPTAERRANRRADRGRRPDSPAIAKPVPVSSDSRRLLWLILGLLALAVVLWQQTSSRQSVPIAGIDAEDYAQIGRQIATGQGFTTLFLPLNGLAWLEDRGSLSPPWPNISRFPLPPLVMALIFSVFGASDVALAGYSLLGWLFGVPFAVLLGQRLGGFRIAALGGALYVLHPDSLQLAISGLTEPLSGAILLAVAWLVLRADLRSAAFAGAIIGLSYWNRTTLLLLAIPAAVVLWRLADDRRRAVLVFAGVAAVWAAPWMIWTWVLTGDPSFNLQTATVLPFGIDSGRPNFPWYTYEYLAPSQVPLGGLVTKWIQQTVGLWDLIPPTLGPFYLSIAALAGWWTIPERHRPLRWLVLAWLILQIVIYGFAGNISRFYTIFLPFVELFGALGLLWAVRRWWREDRFPLAAGTFVLLVALPSLGAVTGLRPFEGSPTRDDALSAIIDVSIDNHQAIVARTAPNDLVLSNVPWSVAWRSARPSAPLPERPDGLAEFEQRTGLRVKALYLTPQMYIVGVPAGWRDWILLRDRLIRDGSGAPAGFTFDRRFRDGSVLLVRQ